ncbi:amidohydrolase [Rhizoctonia solani 123E]|uniref:Amidohydrolase n=1 Tax=Rhizoctonia solani 123E TaxID=1423351 RepID=A0A074RQ49_9AGAM|nr:amidohydrolase [Rhizoctonia solani 123E]
MDQAGTVLSPGALAYTNGVITCLVEQGELDRKCAGARDSRRIINAGGRTLLPGLIDSHMHPLQAASFMLGCSLGYQKLDEESLRNIVQTCIDKDANRGIPANGDSPLTVSDWDREAFTEVAGPANATMLDQLNTTRPIVIIATTQHSQWTNTRVLNLSGVNSSTPEPVDGRILRDARGFPTGVFEEGAINLINLGPGVPPTTPPLDAARLALAMLASKGITSFMDALAFPTDVWRNLSRSDALTARVWNAVGGLGTSPAQEIATAAKKAFDQWDDGDLVATRPSAVWRHAKVFVDGILAAVSQSAGLIEPYFVNNGSAGWVPGANFGIYNFNTNELREVLVQAFAVGINLHIHAIGDGAVRRLFDAIESHGTALKDNQLGIAHAELVHPDDLKRFASLNARAIMSYQWAQPGTAWNNETRNSLTSARMELAEPFQPVTEAGSNVIYGSDWPVDPLDPFLALKAGVTRSGDPLNPNSPANFSSQFSGRFNSQEGLSRMAALRGMTTYGSQWLNASHAIGTLELGKFADIVLLDKPFFDEAAVLDEELGRNKVLLTIVGGRPVFVDADASFVPQNWCDVCIEYTALLQSVASHSPGIVPRQLSRRRCGHAH